MGSSANRRGEGPTFITSKLFLNLALAPGPVVSDRSGPPATAPKQWPCHKLRVIDCQRLMSDAEELVENDFAFEESRFTRRQPELLVSANRHVPLNYSAILSAYSWGTSEPGAGMGRQSITETVCTHVDLLKRSYLRINTARNREDTDTYGLNLASSTSVTPKLVTFWPDMLKAAE